jgi:hypothetical protein
MVGVEPDNHLPYPRIVHGVIDDAVDHVMQARPIPGIADIQTRPLAYGLEAFEDLDRVGALASGDSVIRRRS